MQAAEVRVWGAMDETLAAFEQCFLHQYPRVHGVLCRLVGQPEEAEELAQEVFLRLHRAWPVAGDPDETAAWLHRVATNLGLNALRSRRREEARVDRAARLEPGEAPDPADDALRAETQQLVRRVLTAMPDQQAKLLALRSSGLSYAEIARVLGVAPGSVGTLLARAEREFRRRCEDHASGL